MNDSIRAECQDAGEGTGDCPANVVHVVNEAVAACRLASPGDLSVTSPRGPVLCTDIPSSFGASSECMITPPARRDRPRGRGRDRARPDMSVVMIEDSGPGFGLIPPDYGIGLAEVADIVIKCDGKLECRRGARGGDESASGCPSLR